VQLQTPITSLYDLGKIGYDMSNIGEPKYDTIGVPYWIIEYTDSVVSTSFFASLYPNVPIDSSEYEIIPPDLSFTLDAVVIMWYLRNVTPREKGIINFMMITLHQDSTIYYHVDFNNNRNFTDDGPPFAFSANKQFEEVSIVDNNIVYDFRVNNLAYIEPRSFSLRPIDRDMMWKAKDIKPAFWFSLSFGTGRGKPEMAYTPEQPSDTQLVQYTAQVDASFELKVRAGISFYRFNLGAVASYEKEETSSTNEYIYITAHDGSTEKQINNNTGNWPEYKFSYGLNISYDIPIVRPLRLTPYFGIGSWVYTKDQLFLKKGGHEDRYITDYIKNKLYINYGLELKFLISQSSAFFFHAGFKQNYYDASEYFYDADPTAFTQKYDLFYFGAGVLFRL
jgi:hypothetical protein